MTRSDIQNRILDFITECREIVVEDLDAKLFSPKCGLIAMDMTYVFLQIKKEFQIDLGSLVRAMESRDYSVHSLTDAVLELTASPAGCQKGI